MTKVATFDGVNDGIRIGTTDDLRLVGREFTVEAWVWLGAHEASADGDLALLATRTSRSRNTGLRLGLRQGRVYLGFAENDTAGARRLKAERWYHIAWRYADKTQSVFINGILDGYNRSREPYGGSGLDVFLGMADASHGAQSDRFLRRLSELRIWDHGVSDELIRQRCNRRIDNTVPGLTSLWPLDDLDDAGPHDVKRRIDGTTLGHPTAVDDPALPIYEPATANALAFDRTHNSFRVPKSDHLLPRTFPFLVEAWVRPAALPVHSWQAPIVSQHGPATGWELRAGLHAGIMFTAGQRHHDLNASTRLYANVWQHVLGVFNETEMTLYVNGLREASMRYAGAPVWFNGPLSLGGNVHFERRLYHGVVGDVRLWSGDGVVEQALSGSAPWRTVKGDETGLIAQFPGAERTAMTKELVAELERQGFGFSTVPAQPGASHLQTPWKPPPAPASAPRAPRHSASEKLREAYGEAQQRIQYLEKTVERMQGEAEQQAKQIEALTRVQSLAVDETTLDAFVNDMHKRIERARLQINADGGNYRLGRVNMQAKFLPGARGDAIRFPKPGQDDGGLLTTLDLEFDPSPTGDADVPASRVPDVRGYSEPKARRDLMAAGYAVDIAYESVTDETQEDRVVSQHPTAGAEREPGANVMIFIGKES